MSFIHTKRLGCVVAVVLAASVPHLFGDPEGKARTFTEVWQTVRDNFFDPGLRGVNWDDARERYLEEAGKAGSTEAFANVVNRMLSELKTSHTYYYTPEEPDYYQIAGIFWRSLSDKLKPFLSDGTPRYIGIGISTVTIDGKTFIRAIFDGSPAASAGFAVGDEVVDVDGKRFHPIRSFVGKDDQIVRVQVRRTSATSSIEALDVTPKLLDPGTMFLDAMKSSVQVIEKGGIKVGYLHIWSYAGEVYQEQLEAELNSRLRDVDALVIDLRDGWGGANPKYLWPFVAPPLGMTSISREGKRSDYQTAFTKPVCMLVNEESKSGKELLAYYFRKARRGLIIGSRTGGAVMSGRPFVMADGSLLYVAVADGLVDGIRPEGNGIVPDVQIPFRLEYAAGSDPQKDRAIEEMVRASRR